MVPRSSTHARQRSKNRFFLILLILVVAGFFYLSFLKATEHQAPVAVDAVAPTLQENNNT